MPYQIKKLTPNLIVSSMEVSEIKKLYDDLRDDFRRTDRVKN